MANLLIINHNTCFDDQLALLIEQFNELKAQNQCLVDTLEELLQSSKSTKCSDSATLPLKKAI